VNWEFSLQHAAGEIRLFDVVKKRGKAEERMCKTMTRLKIVDWFSSVGGFSSSAVPEHDVVGGVDCDVEVLRCFKSLFSEATVACRKLPATLHDCNIPMPCASTFWHMSPPCVAFSSARRKCSVEEVDEGIRLLAWSIEMVVRHRVNFSIENVATELPLAIATRYRDLYPEDVDFEVMCASSFGVPQRRRRLIISRPNVIKLLRDNVASPDLVNMKTAFSRRGLPCPGTHVKNATTCKAGPCMRSIDDYSVTLVASRPVHFFRESTKKWTAASETELRTLMDLPDFLEVPLNKRGAVRALGNAVAGGVGRAILRAAKETMTVCVCGREKWTFVKDDVEDRSVFESAIAGSEKCVEWCKKREGVKKAAKKHVPVEFSSTAKKRMREAVVEELMMMSEYEQR
jgi:site-specific DNA-cytosine methylase